MSDRLNRVRITIFTAVKDRMNREWMEAFGRRVWRNYSVELFSAGLVIVFLLCAFIYISSISQRLVSSRLPAVSLCFAAFVFMVGQFYARLKDRREAKRGQAFKLFTEFHSPEFRKHRKYVSRWIDVKERVKEEIPGLRQIELASKAAYTSRVTPNAEGNYVEPTYRSELENPELMEEHFFAIYQYFERWSILVKIGEIESSDANVYSSS